MPRTRLTSFLLLLFALSLSVHAASSDRWLQIHSEHFRIITNSSEKDARHVAAQFERMRSVFNTLIPTAKSDENIPITILALKDKKSFQAIEPAAFLAKGQMQLAGLFLRVPDKNYILVRLDDPGQEEHPYATVYHEYTHLLNSKTAYLPLWLNEGLAEFYQNTDIEEKDVRLGQPSADDIFYLRQQKLLPLTTLLAVDHSSPYYHEEHKGSVFYAESWALTHYLIVSDRRKGTHRIQDYLTDLSQGEDSLTAAQHAFGDLKQVEKDIFGYISQGGFNDFKVPIAFPMDEAPFRVEPLAVTDADAIRADVLVYDNRQVEAGALLENILQEDPQNALAHETMGFLNLRDQNKNAAAKWFGEAVELGSQSYLAHYYFAVLNMNSGSRNADDAVEASLRTSIKLNPDFAPSYDALARFYGKRERNLEEAYELSLQAVQLDPENISFRLDGAHILIEQNRPESVANAIAILEDALKIAKTEQDGSMVQQRLTAYQQIQAKKERAQAAMVTPAKDSASVVSSETKGMIVGDDAATEPHYPDVPATGPHRFASGTLKSVKCLYPTILAFDLEQKGKPMTLYSNNFYKVNFYTLNFKPKGRLKPCTDLEGLNARVEYTELTDKSVAAGQIVKIELSKPLAPLPVKSATIAEK